MLLYSDTTAPTILEAWAEITAFTQSSGRRRVFEYTMHQYRTFNCKPFSLCTTCGWIPSSLLAPTLICVTHGSGQAWQRGITPYHTVVLYLLDSRSAVFVYCMLPAQNIQLQAREEPSNESVSLHTHCICHMEMLVLYTYAYPVCLLLKHLYF